MKPCTLSLLIIVTLLAAIPLAGVRAEGASAQAAQTAPEAADVPASVKERVTAFLVFVGEGASPREGEFAPSDGIAFLWDTLADFISRDGVFFASAGKPHIGRVPRTALLYRAQRSNTSVYLQLSHLGFTYCEHPEVTWRQVGGEYEATLPEWYKLRSRIENGAARVVRIEYFNAQPCCTRRPN